jgi:hypothetical protein
VLVPSKVDSEGGPEGGPGSFQGDLGRPFGILGDSSEGPLGALGDPWAAFGGGWGALRDLWGGLQGALEALESPERSLTEPPKRQCRPSHVQVPREVLPEATQMLPKVMLANI